MLSLRALLWIDCSAAAAVGASGLVLTASGYFVSLTWWAAPTSYTRHTRFLSLLQLATVPERFVF
jgi:hypothetical protein